MNLSDTHFQNNEEGLEFIALSDLTTASLFENLSKAKVMVELAKGFGIVAFADQYSRKHLKWLALKPGES